MHEYQEDISKISYSPTVVLLLEDARTSKRRRKTCITEKSSREYTAASKENLPNFEKRQKPKKAGIASDKPYQNLNRKHENEL